MNLKFAKPVALPGDKCTLKVHTTNGSFVSLLAVDKSVTLMGRDNDINPGRVASDLQMYERSTYENNEELPEKYRDLAESNILVLTNANHEPLSTCIEDRMLVGEDTSNGIWNDDNSDDRIFDLPEETSLRIHDPVRNFFPETWLFHSFLFESPKKVISFHTVAPHTITSFVASGFSIHPEHGLAVIEKPVEIKVFKEFFLKLYIPKAIRLGEVLRVHVSVFNYPNPKDGTSKKPKPINVVVNMAKSKGFEFQDLDTKTCQFTASEDNADNRQKTLTVGANDGNRAYFYIKATHVGRITIRVDALSASRDSIEKHVKVMREGIRKAHPHSQAFDMRDKKTGSFLMILPPDQDVNFVKNSVRVTASITGDLVGPALSNIHSLM